MTFTRLFADGRLHFLPADGSAPVTARVDAGWLADQLRAEESGERRHRARGTLTLLEAVDHDAQDRDLRLLCLALRFGAAAIIAACLYGLLVAAAFLVRG